jgi:ribose transport system permease protein
VEVRASTRGTSRRGLASFEEVGVLGALLILLAVFSLSTDTFFNGTNLTQVARQASYFGIMATGMVFVLTLGEVDLSVGSIVTLVNVLTALALREGAPPAVAILLGLGAGVGCGCLNGALSIVLRIPMILVTLGTLSIYRGLALVVSRATPISQFPRDTFLFERLGGTPAGVPASVLALFLCGLAGHVLLHHTVFGRRVQAIGSNAQAARYSGIRIERHRLLVMALSGLVSAVAGILALAFLESADPKTGEGFELFVIAATVIGGTALTGGSGSVIGAILGALIIEVIRNGLVHLGLTAYWTQVVTGTLIIAAVAVDYLIKKR